MCHVKDQKEGCKVIGQPLGQCGTEGCNVIGQPLEAVANSGGAVITGSGTTVQYYYAGPPPHLWFPHSTFPEKRMRKALSKTRMGKSAKASAFPTVLYSTVGALQNLLGKRFLNLQ